MSTSTDKPPSTPVDTLAGEVDVATIEKAEWILECITHSAAIRGCSREVFVARALIAERGRLERVRDRLRSMRGGLTGHRDDVHTDGYWEGMNAALGCAEDALRKPTESN